MKKFLSYIVLITIVFWLYGNVNISFATVQEKDYDTENILWMKCEIWWLWISNIEMDELILSKWLDDLSFSFLHKKNNETYFYNNSANSVKYKISDDYYISNKTMWWKWNILYWDNNKILVFNKYNTLDNRFLEYEEVEKYEHENYDLIDNDSYIFLWKHIKEDNLYSLVVNWENKYSFTLDDWIELEKEILFSENWEHYIAGYRKNNELFLIIDWKITDWYTNFWREPKIFNNWDYTYIAEKDWNYQYIVNWVIKSKFKVIDDEKNIEIIEWKLKWKKIDAENFHLEIIDNDFYIFWIKRNSNTLEIIKNEDLLESYDNIYWIWQEQLSIDRKKYSLIIQREGNKESLLYLMNWKNNLSEFQFDNIYYANVVFSKNTNKIIYTGSNKKMIDKNTSEIINESVIVNDKIIWNYKEIEANLINMWQIWFDNNDNVFYRGIDLEWNMINVWSIKHYNFNSKINKELSDTINKKKIYDIYYLNKKILSSNTSIDNFERSFTENNYILVKKDLENNLIIYRDWKYIDLDIWKLNENIRINTWLSPDWKKYYVLLSDKETKETILINNWKIIKWNNISILNIQYIKNFWSNNYFLRYSVSEKNDNNKIFFNYYLDWQNIWIDLKSFRTYEVWKLYIENYRNINSQEIEWKTYIFINWEKSKIGFDKIYNWIIIKWNKEKFKFLAKYNNKIQLYSCDLNNLDKVNTEIKDTKKVKKISESNLTDNSSEKENLIIKIKSKSLIFKDLIISKNYLEKTKKWELFLKAINKKIKDLDDKRLIKLYQSSLKFDLNLNKYKKYKDFFKYFQSKAWIEIWKRDNIKKEIIE